MLPPGGKLTRHLDPVAVSLRYHLGLKTPNSHLCYINVDGKKYSWKDGEPFIFDETYLHFAHNDSDQPRIILMCDIKRPLNGIGAIVNFFYSALMKMTVVPNLETDKRGLVNTIFMKMRPLLQKTKSLKQTNRPLYLLIKHTTNTVLIILLIAVLYGILQLFTSLIS
jgi:beta-hydroxylase